MKLNGEIPQTQWDRIARVGYTSDDMQRVMQLLDSSEPFWTLMLGASGVIVATRVNLYPFVDNMGPAGREFDEKKQVANWLGPEAMCMVENGFPTA